MLGRLNNNCSHSGQRLPFFDWFRIPVLYKNKEADATDVRIRILVTLFIVTRYVWFGFLLDFALGFVVTLEPLSRCRSWAFFLFLLQNKITRYFSIVVLFLYSPTSWQSLKRKRHVVSPPEEPRATNRMKEVVIMQIQDEPGTVQLYCLADANEVRSVYPVLHVSFLSILGPLLCWCWVRAPRQGWVTISLGERIKDSSMGCSSEERFLWCSVDDDSAYVIRTVGCNLVTNRGILVWQFCLSGGGSERHILWSVKLLAPAASTLPRHTISPTILSEIVSTAVSLFFCKLASGVWVPCWSWPK